VHFHLAEKRTGSCSAELSFGDANGAPTVRVELDGVGKEYSAVAPGKPDYQGSIQRSAGWHRLQIEFRGEKLVLLIDQYVLGSGPRRALAGPLTRFRFFCEANGGTFHIDDFAVLRAVGELKLEATGDPSQDAIVSLQGDETFGRLTELAGL